MYIYITHEGVIETTINIYVKFKFDLFIIVIENIFKNSKKVNKVR